MTSPGSYAKGQSLIPRADVSLIDLKGRRGAKFRWIMTSVGAALGTTLTVVCHQYLISEELCLLVFAPLGGTVGYLVGRKLDINITHIKLVDDPDRKDSSRPHEKREPRMEWRNPYRLSYREFSVLHLLKNGTTDKEIANDLGISVFTVNKHVSNILMKMDAASRTEASIRALQEGLID